MSCAERYAYIPAVVGGVASNSHNFAVAHDHTAAKHRSACSARCFESVFQSRSKLCCFSFGWVSHCDVPDRYFQACKGKLGLRYMST